MRGKCVRQRSNVKIGSFATLRDFSHTTRANISHERTEQIRARIVRTPAESALAGVDLVCTLTKSGHFASLLLWEKVAREA